MILKEHEKVWLSKSLQAEIKFTKLNGIKEIQIQTQHFLVLRNPLSSPTFSPVISTTIRVAITPCRSQRSLQ